MEEKLDQILEDFYQNNIDLLEVRKQLLLLFSVSASTTVKELHEALKNLLQATDDEGWNVDGKDWEEQEQARKALKNTSWRYLR